MAGPSSITSIPNRRRGRRHRLDIPASLAPTGGDPGRPGIAVRISELSVAGVGLRSDQPLEPGHVYEVRAFDTLVPTGMRVKVISHRAAADGGFEIGAESL
ncbi:MAG TPA: PilZ domain-containing protein [Tepidisphaeraceae bacterium]|nr:PilZ domain-containing protein [Tepidisphaeraceae bacterium]